MVKFLSLILLGLSFSHGVASPLERSNEDILLKRSAEIHIKVYDKESQRPLPTRITVVDNKGHLVWLHRATKKRTAVRKGIFYFDGAHGSFRLQPGEYKIFVTKGFEWSLGEKKISLKKNQKVNLRFEMRREVNTRGYIASDTHIHTRTYSGHGDINVHERVVTIAGEGIELPVATDHNHNTDYLPVQKELKFEEHFTSVVGNEVSTKIGHINAFPFNPFDKVPPFLLQRSWDKLASNIKKKGGQVLVLNHPRWRKKKGGPWGPLGSFGLNQVTGSFVKAKNFPFNAIELENSMTPASDKEVLPFFILKDWMALLNQGYRVTAVGASDSHSVKGIVGQARSYVKSSTDNPSQIDLKEVIHSFKKGKVLVSKGIFADVNIFDSIGVGEMISLGQEKEIEGTIIVRSPSWTTPKEAFIFLNGQKIWSQKINKVPGRPLDTKLSFRIPVPKIDSYLFVYVLGEGVHAPYWKTVEPFTMAATNPIYIDVNGDNHYSSPKELAENWIKKNKLNFSELGKSIKSLRPVVGVQVIDLLFLKRKRRRDKLILQKILDQLSKKIGLFKKYREERLRQ